MDSFRMFSFQNMHIKVLSSYGVRKTNTICLLNHTQTWLSHPLPSSQSLSSAFHISLLLLIISASFPAAFSFYPHFLLSSFCHISFSTGKKSAVNYSRIKQRTGDFKIIKNSHS